MLDVLFLWQHLEHKKYNNVKYLFFAIEKCRSFLKIIFEPLNSEKTNFKNWNFQLLIVNKSRMSSKNVCKSSFELHSWKLLFSPLKNKIVRTEISLSKFDLSWWDYKQKMKCITSISFFSFPDNSRTIKLLPPSDLQSTTQSQSALKSHLQHTKSVPPIMQLHMINIVVIVWLLLAQDHAVVGLPVNNHNNKDSIIDVTEIDPVLPEDTTSTSSPSSTSPNPTETSAKPLKHKNKPQRSLLEIALGCQNFVCLLSKFDLLKTDSGYLLTPFEDRTRTAAAATTTTKKASKDCKRFDCWLSQFNSKQKSYGWELTLKTGKGQDRSSSLSNLSSLNSLNNNAEEVLQKTGKSLEPDWPLDIVGDLMLAKSSSSQSNPQKSPIIEYDTLFSQT